ncbi:hypothetical protein like AT3G60380 [Hibiscus trionum]|uniref:Uncharacterized protein n=1 Tax=Hibiscus trionum TaxID=183268 RepID=A0A9W7MC30_HIBTR|nr:hypothetical protein like AT3G60380 [Hibiscus trionum]
MADSYPPFTTRPSTEANTIPRNDTSNNRFLGKFLFFTFFLIAIPLFPSQPPDFINQTVLNKFWELLHLLFIGIAVSYGLFGRRNVDNVVSHDDSNSFASGISIFSSVFEDGFDNSLYCSEQGKAGVFDVKNCSFENPFEGNVVQAWSSKYVQGEPMVVLAEPYCELGSFVDHKPLGLPVRSLKSRVESRVGPEFGNGSSEPSVVDSSDSSDKSESERFSDLGSDNLEGKYNGSDVLRSPIAWRSRSVRMRQRVGGGGATRPSHFRPLSVDETQFQSLKSRSLHSQLSSHSPSSLSPSHSSSSESPDSKMIESPKEWSPRQSFPHTSVNASHSRKFSDGSLLGTRSRKCFEDELKELCDNKKDDSSSSTTKEWISGYPLKFDSKPAAPSKVSSRGKSVWTFRTFRGSGSTRGYRDAGEKRDNHTKGKLTMGSEGSKGETELKFGFKSQYLGGNSDLQNPTFSKNQNQEQIECSENSESEGEDEDFQVSSGEETMSGTFGAVGSDSYEVDRKAGEFIAKFRQQIGLQRTTSIDSPKGINTSGNKVLR